MATPTTTINSDIIPERVPFLDARTGLISRPWFLFFLNLFARLNANVSADLLSVAPEAVDGCCDPSSELGVAPFAGEGPQGPPGAAGSDGMMPYFIAVAEEFIVPLYKQGLFEMIITVDGILTVDGFLIEVD